MEEIKTKKRIGLALSGGGYRAAAFHLGVLKKLNELGVLNKLDVISTISGGSIAGAFYVLNKHDFTKFETEFRNRLKKSVIRRIIWSVGFWVPILIFLCGALLLVIDIKEVVLPLWVRWILFLLWLMLFVFFQFRIISFSRLKTRAYKKIFFEKHSIADLPDTPVLAINATNLSTGTLWTFSKKKTSDSSYEYPKDGGAKIFFDCSAMPLAKAVAASTSVPVPFDPIRIEKKYFKDKTDYKRIKPSLIDGGLYDNQGIHKITQKNSSYACDIIIVSDGSQPFPNQFKAWNTSLILYRGIDVMMRKIKNLQFIRDVFSTEREIAYFSLDWRYQRSVVEFVNSIRNGYISKELLTFHGIDNILLAASNSEIVRHVSQTIDIEKIIKNGLTEQEIKYVSKISTNLTALTDKKIDLLSRHGQVLTELQIKLYCPSLTNQNS